LKIECLDQSSTYPARIPQFQDVLDAAQQLTVVWTAWFELALGWRNCVGWRACVRFRGKDWGSPRLLDPCSGRKCLARCLLSRWSAATVETGHSRIRAFAKLRPCPSSHWSAVHCQSDVKRVPVALPDQWPRDRLCRPRSANQFPPRHRDRNTARRL